MKNTTKCLWCGVRKVRFDLCGISGMEPEEGFCSEQCLVEWEAEMIKALDEQQ